MRPGNSRMPRPVSHDLRDLDIKNAIWKVMRHAFGHDDVSCLRRLLDIDVRQDHVDEIFGELKNADVLRNGMQSPAVRTWNTYGAGHIDPDDLFGLLELCSHGRGRFLFLYVAARLLQPEVVIETGCFTGRDSAVILYALEQNSRGHLYTIDLPPTKGRLCPTAPVGGLPAGLNPGFLVPEALSARWSLIIGDARRELPALLNDLDQIGLFFHDSDHTYSHMMWEYATVWPQVAEGGLIVSDDIGWNTAFWDFARGVGRPVVIHRTNANVGALSLSSKGRG